MSINEEKLRKLLNEIQSKDKRLAEELEQVRKKEEVRNEAREKAPFIKSEKEGNFESLDTSTALETIVLRHGRPVLIVARHEAQLVFPDVESEVWRERLINAKDQLLATVPSVGRIELENSSYDWIGTGWLVDQNIIVTNRHVAEVFAKRNGSGFVFRQGINSSQIIANIDLLEEEGNPDELVFSLNKVLHIEPESGADMAFIAVESSSNHELPTQIKLSREGLIKDMDVAVIGYPARDSRIIDQQLMERIFGNVYNKKRLAPGKITEITSTRLFHDCSTLGGCSGGAILDLRTGEAVGLHFAGRYLESNFAVPAALVSQRLQQIKSNRRILTPAQPLQQSSRSINMDGGNTFNASVSVPLDTASQKSYELTIPLHITFSIDSAQIQNVRLSEPGAAITKLSIQEDFVDEDINEEAKPEDYENRIGYLENFLGEGFEVSLPQVVGERWKDDVLTFTYNGVEDYILKYEHFSVVMSHSRRLCFFSAVNINGRSSKEGVNRVGWRLDPRIPREAQIIKECYGPPPKYSRGHMTRREDPIWGREVDAMRGNADSMCVTNAVPQMQTFNAPVWLDLEDYALDHARADKMHISVFTGPIFRSDDRVQYGVKIPIQFWKVIVFIHDETGKLSATGYIMSQNEHLPEEEFVFGDFGEAQVPIVFIEKQTGLSFGKLKDVDPMNTTEEGFGALIKPLKHISEIQFM